MNRKKAIRKDKSKKDKAQKNQEEWWLFHMSTHSRKKKKRKRKKNNNNNNNNNVYSLNRDRAATVVKPQTTFRQVLVHLKDKVDKQKKAGVVCKFHETNMKRYTSVKKGDS